MSYELNENLLLKMALEIFISKKGMQQSEQGASLPSHTLLALYKTKVQRLIDTFESFAWKNELFFMFSVIEIV